MYFLSDEDPSYIGDLPENVRTYMAKEGKFCFATCSKTVKVPVGYFLKRAKDIYTPRPEQLDYTLSQSLSDFFHHWCLLEIINGLGGHSLL